MNGPGHWITLDSLIFLNKLYLSIKDDEPLDLVLRRIFTGVLEKLMFYSNCDHGLHLMANAIGTPDDDSLYKFEISHLFLPGLPSKRRQPPSVARENFPPYVRYEQADTAVGVGLREMLLDQLQNRQLYAPGIHASAKWCRLIEACNDQRRLARDGKHHVEISTPDEVLVILFSEADRKLPAGRLGVLLLWGNDDIDGLLRLRDEQLFHAASCFGQFIEKFFESHYKIEKGTYLPSYRIPGPRSVAILFADIRDFTPMTEIARNFNLLEELRLFISEYCRRLCNIIQENRGRVHSLAGDGIMALFGEYDIPKEAVENAVTAAKLMCSEFNQIKQEFLRQPEIRKFLRSAYEPMSPRLGIGINFGEVLLDYFGAEGSREYSPLGDHVNFAQRLESEASRYDESLFDAESRKMGRMRAPILLSRPAWIVGEFSPPGKDPDLNVHVKGKPYAYPAYERWPEGT